MSNETKNEFDISGQKEQQMMNALCISYTAAYCCDLMTDSMEVIKQKNFSHCARERDSMNDPLCYSEWIHHAFETFIIKESAPDYLEVFDAQNLMRRLQKEESFVYRHQTRPNAAGMEYFETTIVRLYMDEHSFKVIMGYRPIDDIIAEEKKRQHALESEVAALRNVHETLGSGGWRLEYNEKGEMTSCKWSDTMRKMLGFTSTEDFPDEFESWINRLHPDDKEHTLDEYRASVQDYTGKKIYDMEYRVKAKDGTYHWFRAAGRLSRRSDGSPIAFDGVFINTDEKHETKERLNRALQEAEEAGDGQKRLQKAYEVAENANEAKTTFLLNMSHDIRTPMNAILGYSKLMRTRITDPELLHYQDMIEQSGNLLLSIINNVLDMARIESGKMELDENYNTTGDIVSGVCSVFEMEAKRKNLTITRRVEVEHRHIVCDKTKMQEILTNIISNAVKYTPPGGKIRIETIELPCEREGYVTIQTSVEDTGIGMSKEFLPQLFDSFSRERNTTAAKVAGSGLGMAIVKSLVDLMGGTIEVESELGKGSKFTVTIPHKIVDEAYYEKQMLEKSAQHADFSGKHILLAEDNELNAEIAITILEEMGFSVDHAEDGILCVDKLEREPAGTYDVILMDIQMPNMDGYKATKVIRRLPDKKKSNIPIIAMTANAFAEDRKKALEMGMNGHIAKPIDVDKIREVLAKVLNDELA